MIHVFFIYNIRQSVKMFLNKKFLLFLVVGVTGDTIFLATRDIPAPQQPVEKAIPNDRFLK